MQPLHDGYLRYVALRLEAVIALKTLSHAKQRLSAALTNDAREALVEAMALDVIASLSKTKEVLAVHVICGDGWTHLKNLPAPVRVWREPDGQSEGLVGALEWVSSQVDSEALLFIHGDLPFIDQTDISLLVSAAGSHHAVISPDRSHAGTNALLRWQSQSLPLAFGQNSYARHIAVIESAGLQWREVTTVGLKMDIDEPTDLQLLADHSGRLGAHATAWWQLYGDGLFTDATQKVV